MDEHLPSAAEEQLYRAAKRGEKGAPGELAWQLFRSGARAEALPWLDRACADGDARAHYLLGIALFNGDGIAPDPDRAVALLRVAADRGVEQARAALAEIGDGRSTPAGDLLLSAAASEAITADLSRLHASSRPAEDSLGMVVRSLLIPLLRERLEEALPVAVRRAVDETLDHRESGQPSPARS